MWPVSWKDADSGPSRQALVAAGNAEAHARTHTRPHALERSQSDTWLPHSFTACTVALWRVMERPCAPASDWTAHTLPPRVQCSMLAAKLGGKKLTRLKKILYFCYFNQTTKINMLKLKQNNHDVDFHFFSRLPVNVKL